MTSLRPKIGVTGPDSGGFGAWFFTSLSLELAGAKPVRVTPNNQVSMKHLDGLIIGGGADIEPSRYGKELLQEIDDQKKTLFGKTVFQRLFTLLLFPVILIIRILLSTQHAAIDKKRDDLEFELLAEALQQNKPVLGICRGMQLINIHQGGNLHQNIDGFYGEREPISTLLPKKNVRLANDSLLAEIIGEQRTQVNALHSQAVDKPGQGLRVVATEFPNNITQAIEHETHPFLIGVQWHPEYLIQLPEQRAIFKRLVKCATENCAT
jgi:putative glutamine amidotransferase